MVRRIPKMAMLARLADPNSDAGHAPDPPAAWLRAVCFSTSTRQDLQSPECLSAFTPRPQHTHTHTETHRHMVAPRYGSSHPTAEFGVWVRCHLKYGKTVKTGPLLAPRAPFCRSRTRGSMGHPCSKALLAVCPSVHFVRYEHHTTMHIKKRRIRTDTGKYLYLGSRSDFSRVVSALLLVDA